MAATTRVVGLHNASALLGILSNDLVGEQLRLRMEICRLLGNRFVFYDLWFLFQSLVHFFSRVTSLLYLQ